jgi:hypothetical protein
MLGSYSVILADIDAIFYDISEFTDIPGITVGDQLFQTSAGKPRYSSRFVNSLRK